MARMEFQVTTDDTAIALGSGSVAVLGTPRVVAWLEAATVAAAGPLLEAGETTVGTALRVGHHRPTPVGGQVTVTAGEPVVDGRRMTFSVKAIDDSGEVVADGEIDRIVVDQAKFEARAGVR
ncbi:thioesterase family protein [Knoellia koreensis]|nr:hotdog domain-containing protein [Knoellia sp. DB2414S]